MSQDLFTALFAVFLALLFGRAAVGFLLPEDHWLSEACNWVGETVSGLFGDGDGDCDGGGDGGGD